MNDIDLTLAVPSSRVFLPTFVRLQSNLCGCYAHFLTRHDDGRAHDDRVEELYGHFCGRGLPFLALDEEAEQLVAYDAGRALAKGLRARGFARPSRTSELTLPVEPSTLVATLAWAEAAGMGLCPDAWDVLGDAGRRPRPRQLAWDVDDPEFGDEAEGEWATRLLDADEALPLRAELLQAIDMSWDRAVHLTPLPYGSLRARLESTDYEVRSWRAQYDGCGALVIKREESSLRVYLPSCDWISWGLQRALLDAWAEESFGEGTPWHWG